MRKITIASSDALPAARLMCEELGRQSGIETSELEGVWDGLPQADHDLIWDIQAALGERWHALDGDLIGDCYQLWHDEVRISLNLVQSPGFIADWMLEHSLGVALDSRHAPTFLEPSAGCGHIAVRALKLMALGSALGAQGVFDILSALGRITCFEINPEAAAICRWRLTHQALVLARALTPHTWSDGTLVRTACACVHVRDALMPAADLDGARYDVIVGNPPYGAIGTPEDRETYRIHFESAYMQFGLHGPFIEKTLQWATPGACCTMIVSNNFMKRSWGTRFIERVVPRLGLRAVIDTSGAYIPGHGTPTVILFWRPHTPAPPQVCTVFGIRGEPSTPADPSQGVVWRSIVEHASGSLRRYMVATKPEEAPERFTQDTAGQGLLFGGMR